MGTDGKWEKFEKLGIGQSLLLKASRENHGIKLSAPHAIGTTGKRVSLSIMAGTSAITVF